MSEQEVLQSPYSKDVKTCSSCLHHLTTKYQVDGTYKSHECRSNNNPIISIDLVSGDCSYRFVNCHSARTQDTGCGLDAKWHAPRFSETKNQGSASEEAPTVESTRDRLKKLQSSSPSKKFVIGDNL